MISASARPCLGLLHRSTSADSKPRILSNHLPYLGEGCGYLIVFPLSSAWQDCKVGLCTTLCNHMLDKDTTWLMSLGTYWYSSDIRMLIPLGVIHITAKRSGGRFHYSSYPQFQPVSRLSKSAIWAHKAVSDNDLQAYPLSMNRHRYPRAVRFTVAVPGFR